MDPLLSTRQLGWILDRSPEAIREQIRDGDIEGVRLPAGFRIPKAEAMRLARVRLETEAGKTLSDRRIEQLIDEVIATNERATADTPT
jgi:hypothetical protein